MKFLPVTMIINDLKNFLFFKFPAGYTVRNFRKGENLQWAEIETAAGEFKDIKSALDRFDREFSPVIEEFKNRCIFLLNKEKRIIGTATAWYNPNFLGEYYGRIHWVAIHPEYQGKKLAKPLLSAVIKKLAQFHSKAYLTTQTTSYKAVKIYLDFGFEPLQKTEKDAEGWRLLAQKLRHPKLLSYL